MESALRCVFLDSLSTELRLGERWAPSGEGGCADAVGAVCMQVASDELDEELPVLRCGLLALRHDLIECAQRCARILPHQRVT